MVFRCTRKVLARMRIHPTAAPPPSTGRLGDWYVGQVFLDRRPLFLFVSERTRLPVLVSASPLNAIPARFKSALGEILAALAVDPRLAAEELQSVDDVVVARTQSRSILGTLNDFTFALKLAAADRRRTDSYDALSLWLAETPVVPLNDCPDRATKRLLTWTVH